MRSSTVLSCAGVFLVAGAMTAGAQQEAEPEEPQTHLLTITTFQVAPGDEAQAFWEYVDKYVVPSNRENPHILSERMGSHHWGYNEQNVWWITEYENLAGLQAAEDWTDDYNEEHFPEGSAGADSLDAAFQEKFLPHFTGHRDYILTTNMTRVK